MVAAVASALPVRTPEFEQFLFGCARPAACDPLVPMDSTPLAERLAPGQYEVVLFVLTGNQHGAVDTRTECNAAAALLCSSDKPARWELAVREGGHRDAAAYGVDSGTGGFMGSRAIEQLLDGDNAFGDAIVAALQDTSGAVVSIAGGVSAAAFRSGAGDGTYDTWLGRDTQGEPAVILTDFDVLRSEEYVSRVHAEWAARKARKWWQLWR